MNRLTKNIIGSLFAVTALTVYAHSEEPQTLQTRESIEARVVEIHMTTREVMTVPEKRKQRKATTLPYLGHGTCSGAFINDNGDILTAKHCVADNPELDVLTYDQRHYAAVLIATSSTHDLALIHIDRRNTSFFELAREAVRGEAIFVLGSPLGITDTLSAGLIAKLDGDITFIDCSALPGNSGSTVFNREGKLVGVLNAGLIVFLGTTHLNIMQSVDTVHFFLEEVEKKRHS